MPGVPHHRPHAMPHPRRLSQAYIPSSASAHGGPSYGHGYASASAYARRIPGSAPGGSRAYTGGASAGQRLPSPPLLALDGGGGENEDEEADGGTAVDLRARVKEEDRDDEDDAMQS